MFNICIHIFVDEKDDNVNGDNTFVYLHVVYRGVQSQHREV